jgi:hypothetical protein
VIEVGQHYENRFTGNGFTVTQGQADAYKNNASFRRAFDSMYFPQNTLGDILRSALEQSKQSNKKFWMVKGNGPTNFKHRSKEAAVKEAERLANVHQGKEFYVLEAICIKKASKMVTLDL